MLVCAVDSVDELRPDFPTALPFVIVPRGDRHFFSLDYSFRLIASHVVVTTVQYRLVEMPRRYLPRCRMPASMDHSTDLLATYKQTKASNALRAAPTLRIESYFPELAFISIACTAAALRQSSHTPS